MAFIVSVEQAAANALSAWIASQMGDCACSPRWADASLEFSGKAITVMYSGDPTVDYVSDNEVVARTNTSATRADFTFLRSSFTQPFQIDVWATSDVARDDIVARLKNVLNASEGATLGRTNADPFRDGVLVALADGWAGYADFLFDTAQKSDTADANARREFRASYRGTAQLVDAVVANRARLRPTLHLNAHPTDTPALLGELASVSTAGTAAYFEDLSVTGTMPASVPANGGSLAILGTGFRPGTTVSFGGAALTPTITSPTTMTIAAPAHAAGTGTFTVTTPGPNSATAPGTFGYLPDPVISTLTPSSLPATLTTALTIDGTGFVVGPGTTVSVGGSHATSVNVVSALRITCVAPTHAAGATTVVVTNPSGQTSNAQAVTYVAAPAATSFAPSSLRASLATSVAITGTGFVQGATVTFDGTIAASPVVTNGGVTLTCTAPTHAAGSVAVIVTNPDGQTSTTSIGYDAAPTVTSIATSAVTATQAYSDQPTNLTLTGTGFVAGATVKVNGVSATSVVVVNATSITCTTAPQAAGSQTVVVTNADTQAGSASLTFTSTPTMVGGAKMWVNARTGVTTSGTDITALADQSGNGNNLTVTPATPKPQYVAVGNIGGLPAIRMAGSTYIQNSGSLTTAQPLTVYVVASRIGPSAGVNLALFDGKTNRLLYYRYNPTNDYRLFSAGAEFIMPNVAWSTTGEVFCAVFNNGGTSAVYRNDSTNAVGTGIVGTSSFDGFTLGAYATLNTAFWNGDYNEVIVMSGAHSQAQRAAVMGWLAYQNNVSGVA